VSARIGDVVRSNGPLGLTELHFAEGESPLRLYTIVLASQRHQPKHFLVLSLYFYWATWLTSLLLILTVSCLSAPMRVMILVQQRENPRRWIDPEPARSSVYIMNFLDFFNTN